MAVTVFTVFVVMVFMIMIVMVFMMIVVMAVAFLAVLMVVMLVVMVVVVTARTFVLIHIEIHAGIIHRMHHRMLQIAFVDIGDGGHKVEIRLL